MKLLKDLKINYRNIELYETALSHTSYANENGVDSYERLEYLGDAVLELIISDYIYNTTSENEGAMTKLRASYVQEDALYEYAVRMNIPDYIKLGVGEEENGGRFRKTIVADILEALLGAIFLDLGFIGAKNFVHKHIIPIIESDELNINKDYKSILQEYIQTDQRSLEYNVVDESGPAHNKTFTIEVKIDDIVYGVGVAHSKKEAEMLAAKNALEKSVNK